MVRPSKKKVASHTPCFEGFSYAPCVGGASVDQVVSRPFARTGGMSEPSIFDRLPTVAEIRREIERTNKFKRMLRQLLVVVETTASDRKRRAS